MDQQLIQQQLKRAGDQLGLNTDAASDRRPNWVTGNINGFKIEIEYRKRFEFIVDYHEYGLAQQLKERYDCFRNTTGARVYFDTIAELISFGLEVIDFIYDNGLRGNWQQREIPTTTTNDGLFEKTAKAFKALVEIEAWDFLDNRKFFDAHDDFAIISESSAYTTAKAANPNYSGRREHIVPCTMIKTEAVRMVRKGATIGEIAQMLKTNLAIVMISDEEQKRLDAVYQTTMPQGWEFGDSIFARLDVMGIDY